MHHPTSWGPLPGGFWTWSLLSKGPRPPSLVLSPPCSLTAYLLLMLLLTGSHKHEVLQTATMIAALFLHLGVLHSSHKMHHELPSDSIKTIRVFAFHVFFFLGTVLFQVCQVHSRCFKCWLDPLELPQGEETSHPEFGSVISCLASWALG